MKKNKKIFIIVIIVLVLILLIVGVTYSVLSYTGTGTNQELIVGDIWMKYTGNNHIDVGDMMPTKINYILNTSEEATSKCVNYIYNTYGKYFYEIAYNESIDGPVEGINNNHEDVFVKKLRGKQTYSSFCKEDNFLSVVEKNNWFTTSDIAYFEENNILINTSSLPYFEFTIEGKNTYEEKDIWYEIILNYGSDHDERTERIKDDLLKFKLVSVIGEEETVLFANRSYSSLENKRIWVDTIEAGKSEVVNNKYRLYMWIDNNAVIGNTNDADYDLNTWNNQVYASVRVDVKGDLKEKEVTYEDMYDVTDASCFTSGLVVEGASYIVNPVMKEQEVEEVNELTACEIYFKGYPLDEGTTAQSFCRGEGTYFGRTFQEDLDAGNLANVYLEEYNIIVANGDSYIVNPVMKEQEVEEVNELTVCVTGMGDIPFDEGSDATSFCQGTGTSSLFTGSPLTFQEYVYYTLEQNGEKEFLETVGRVLLSGNILIISGESSSLAIIDYDASCGSDVVIPETIEGYPVKIIGNSDTKVYSYLTQIDNNHFNSKSNNLLYDTSKNKNNGIIPIAELGVVGAFEYKGLTSVIIPNTVEIIEDSAFSENSLTTIEIPSSVQFIINGAFDNNNLKKITLKNGLRVIDAFAFTLNPNLKVVNIPSSVTYISCFAFDDDVEMWGKYLECEY